MDLNKEGKMGLTGEEFSQNIMKKYTDSRISTNFTSTSPVNKITIPAKFLEFIYSSPFMILKKEIINSFKKTERSLKSFNHILNISLNLDFPFDKHRYIHKYLPSKNGKPYQNLKEYKPEKTGSTIPRGPLPPSTEFFSKFFPESPPQTIYNILGRRVPSYGSNTEIKYSKQGKTDPHGNFEKRKVLGNGRLSFLKSNYSPRFISRIDYFKFFKAENKYGDLFFVDKNLDSSYNRVGFEWKKNKLSKEKTYFTTLDNLKNIFDVNDASKISNNQLSYVYPKIEHFNVVKTEITREKLIEKENSSETPQVPEIDLDRIVDQVYSSIEMKLKIEKERRGLFG